MPNTSYMFHFYAFAFGQPASLFDNESAFTYGAGNGTAQDPPTGGWFYFKPSSILAVPEPGSLGMLGLGLGLLGLGLAWDKRRRRDRANRTGQVPTGEHALA